MPIGLDLFREAFAAYADCYVPIGGVACAIVLDSIAILFRATKHLDIVLCAASRMMIAGKAGTKVKARIEFLGGRRHLPFLYVERI